MKESPERDTRMICLNGTDFEVTESLASALEHLRPALGTDATSGDFLDPRKLWVDALCINQKDMEEKSQQVQMMRDIYKKAKDAVIWIGPARDESDVALEFIERIGRPVVKPPKGTALPRLRRGNAFADEKFKESVPIKELQAFWSRSWWRRVWVRMDYLF